MTKLLMIRDRSVVRSSVIASTKYSCSGSFDRFAKGSTTIDRRGAGFDVGEELGALPANVALSWGHNHHAPTPVPITAIRPSVMIAVHGQRRRGRAPTAGNCTGTSGVAATAPALSLSAR